MDHDKGKAVWDVESSRIFINACIEQIYGKQRQENSFTKIGWDNIATTFTQIAGRAYDKKQLKNKFNIMRKEWKTWDTLFAKETGLGRNPITNTVVASNEWWQRKIQENPLYRRYRYNGLMFERELNIIFKDVVASGEYILAPSSTEPQTQGTDHKDVYQPNIDLEEGSGDNEEENFGVTPGANVGVTNEVASINLTTNTVPSVAIGLGSKGKRKRGEWSIKSKKQKLPSLKLIADAVSQMAIASKDRTTLLREMKAVSIIEVMSELIRMEELADDDDFRNRCINILMDKTCRETFVGLKVNRPYLISWLRHIAYNPPPWLRTPAP